MTVGAAPARAGWRDWLGATRPPTLSAAVVPVLVGSAVAADAGVFRADAFALALAAAVLLQVGANLANDYFDHRSGADSEARRGPRRLIQRGLASPAAVAAAAACALALAALAGIGLIAIGGWPIAAVGIASIAAAIAYTGGPVRYGYRGLGDLAVFVFFGPVAVAGTAYVHLGHVPPAALALAAPVGCLVTAILVVNNVRDIETDRAAGKRTLAVIAGARLARAEYVALVGGAYVLLVVLAATGAVPVGALFALPSVAIAVPLMRAMRPDASAGALNAALRATGRLHLAFGASLSLGLLVV